MRKLLSFQLASRVLITILSLLILLHLLILFGVLPGDIVWGSRITNDETLFFMELISLVVTILFLINTLVYIKEKSATTKRKIVRALLWFMSLYFFLNIFGNLSSASNIESFVFTPVALILAITSFRLATEKPST